MTNELNEEWKDIEGYEGLYQISNKGRVKSLGNGGPSKYRGKVIIKKQRLNNMGYYYVGLWRNSIVKHYMVHKLVGTHFIPNPDNLPCINHKDENPKNNCVDNLEWCTYKYNSNYGTCIKRRSEKKRKPVNQYDLDGNYIRTWESISEASISLGINDGQISNVVNNKPKHKTAGGYIWRKAV